ncbi:MAG TPA: NYN domain-containing protein [Terriglobia bacterium]
MAEERLKLAVFVDFDNIQIGVKDTLSKDFDVSIVLEALKERGEVVTKIAYSDWSRASEFSRQMTQHAVQMVQRNVTPRGDKNGADINLALDALEMAFTRHHINAFAIVGGDSDFIALVEKLKQYDKRVFIVGGRAFTSNILQRNCTEFIAYENLLRAGGDGGARQRAPRRGEPARSSLEVRPLSDALPNVRRALGVLAEREVSPQLGLLKSTLLQLDSTFSERDYGAGSFLEFMQKMEEAGLVYLRKLDRGYRVEIPETATPSAPAPAAAPAPDVADEVSAVETSKVSGEAPPPPEPTLTPEEALAILRRAVELEAEKSPNRPLYLRHIRHGLRSVEKDFDERRAGFQGLTDFLYRAQKEGWLSMQRDRNGVLRMFYHPQAEQPEMITEHVGAGRDSVAAVEATAVQAEATASTDFWASTETVAFPGGQLQAEVEASAPRAEEVSGASPTSVAESFELSATRAPDAAASSRKARPRRAGKTGQRKTPSRRKSKEKVDSE